MTSLADRHAIGRPGRPGREDDTGAADVAGRGRRLTMTVARHCRTRTKEALESSKPVVTNLHPNQVAA
jgi:hypothetical protein